MFIVLTIAGVAARLLWMHHHVVYDLMVGEALNVSRAFGRSWTIADPFRNGQGPTAHVTPIPMIIAGTVFHVLGERSAAAAVVLTTWSLFLVFLSFYFTNKCFEEVGLPLKARVAAFSVLALLPLNFSLETVFFQVWEGGLAVALSSFYTWRILVADRLGKATTTTVATLGFVAAVTLFVSPPLGVAAYLSGIVLLVRKLAPKQWLGAAAVVVLITIAVLTPWTLRNLAQFDRLIVLRDNFGLEVAQAYYPAALTQPDTEEEFTRRHAEIHPYGDGPGYANLVAAGGEAAYADKLGRQVKQWIRDNPKSFAILTCRHLSNMFFPPAWYHRDGPGKLGRQISNWIISLLGLSGIVYALMVKSRRYLYLAIATIVPVLPYMIVLPTLRYRYIILSMLVFFAVDFLTSMYRLSRRSVPASPSPAPSS